MNTYKDDTYENTISKIRAILADNNIIVNIKVTSGFDGVFSAYLNIIDTPFYVNGKGLSEEQAIASAYGELMERFQNRVFFRFHNTFVTEEQYKYIYSYKEIAKELGYVVANRKYLGSYLSSLSLNEAEEIIKDSLIIHSKREYESNLFMCVPYFCNNEQKCIDLPAELIKYIYASNGMCAGNTEEEALVQGISEIFERYANRILLSGKVVPPDIPISVLKKFHHVKSFIENIEKRDDFRIIFKDCSLGIGLPVVCLILIDRKNGKYFVKFGAHPILEVALNRTITEMFQGRKISMSSFWFKDVEFYKDINYQNEFKKIFRSGDGEYPTEIFQSEHSYNFNAKWENVVGYNNKEQLEILKNIIIDNGWNLLYCDLSFLNFPAYHVIIPEISEIVELDKKFISLYSKRIKVNKFLREIPNISDEELSECILFILSCDYPLNTKLGDFLNISISEDSSKIYNNLIIGDLAVLYYLKFGKYYECIKTLDRIIDCEAKESRKVYYKCVKNYIKSVFVLGKDKDQIKNMLYRCYNNNLVNQVIDMIARRKQIFTELPLLKCSNCEECSYINGCSMRYAYEINRYILEGWDQ